MSIQMVGLGSVYSMPGTVQYYGYYSYYGVGLTTEANIEERHNTKYLYTADGDIVASKVSGVTYHMNINFFPVGGRGALGQLVAANNIFLPPIYSMLYLNNFPYNIQNNVKFWNYNGNGRINFGQFAYAYISLPLIYIPSMGASNYLASRNLASRMQTV